VGVVQKKESLFGEKRVEMKLGAYISYYGGDAFNAGKGIQKENNRKKRGNRQSKISLGKNRQH